VTGFGDVDGELQRKPWMGPEIRLR
jgi:hypothetical protein